MSHPKSKRVAALGALCLAAALTAAGPAGAEVRDLHFARGASSTTVSGSIVGRDDNRYRVRAQEGQTIKVTLKPRRPTTYFNVNPPDSDQSIFVGSNEGNVYEGRLAASGVYEIVVYQMGGAASDNKQSGYQLTVAVTGGAGGQSAAGKFSAGQTVMIGGARSDALDAVELRDGPGRGGVVGRVGNGRLMTVDNCEGDWCHVRTTTGSSTAGWVESRYLRSK
ncbi:MAG: SH3 domain-containing protein [Betaproteobacteria bacterium]